MDSKIKKQGRAVLGRGLAALISAPPIPVQTATVGNAETAAGATEGQPPQVSVIQGGLSAPKTETQESGGTGVRFVTIDKVKPNPKQPRTEFNEPEIAELADSIRTLGVLQPVLVRPKADGQV